MDAPSAQLKLEQRSAVVKALATRRPILHHLNADTSWLLQIPRPASAVARGGRVYYNVLIDPWFVGGQSDGATWFSQQWHATASVVASVAEVDELARRIEALAGGVGPVKGRGRAANGQGVDEASLVDVVAVSHEFTDHCHKDTLLQVHRDVPVIATEQAAHLISSWQHFRTVLTAPTFHAHSSWRDASLCPLPPWLSIARLTAPADLLFYHSALLIAFATHPFAAPSPARKRPSLCIDGDGADSAHSAADDAAECVVYTPHGVPLEALAPVLRANSPLRTLAFLHGLHDVSISAAQQLNLGARNGLLVQRALRAKYWIGTHDEVKKGGGLVSWFLRRKVWTLEEALREARAESGDEAGEWEDVRFQELANGESRVLE